MNKSGNFANFNILEYLLDIRWNVQGVGKNLKQEFRKMSYILIKIAFGSTVKKAFSSKLKQILRGLSQPYWTMNIQLLVNSIVSELLNLNFQNYFNL